MTVAEKELKLHSEADQFESADGCLCVGGRSLLDIASELGSTPFYVYDSAHMKRRVAELRDALPDSISLHYAMKANPMPAVVKLMSGLVDGLDVASAGELDVALTTGCRPEDISFAGPGKKVAELEKAIDAGITLNVESPTELQRIATIAAAKNVRPRVAIRVNPDFELKSSGMKMSGGPKQFGIDAEDVPDILQSMSDLPLQFVGFHIFSGSQNLRPESIAEAQSKALDLAMSLSEHAPNPPEMINIGGGLGVPYFPGDKPLELQDVSANLQKELEGVYQRYPDVEIVIELGRYLVAEAGLYVCRVLDRKISRGQVFLVTDGGLHHHLAASGNFGQVLRKNYPVTVANRLDSDDFETASVVGPLCTPLDLLADRMHLPRADIDDLIVVFQSGAYGFTASPHYFLGHPPPQEILC